VLSAPNNNLVTNRGNWTVQWGDGGGQVHGNILYSLLDDSFTVNITSNPNRRFVNIFIDLRVTPQLAGRRVISYMHVDGPAAPTMFTTNWGQQIPTRAVNSLTAALWPRPLQQGDKLVIQLPPVASGQFTFDTVGVTPID